MKKLKVSVIYGSVRSSRQGIKAARFILDKFGFKGDTFQSEHTFEILKRAEEFIGNGCSGLQEFEFGEVFIENIIPPTDLMIFGAGADAVQLAGIAKQLGWRVSVIDHRPAFANEERFPNADKIIISRPGNLKETLLFDESPVAVVMTHNYEHDKQILRFLLRSNPAYIGALGPKQRTKNILRELKESGENFSEDDLQKLHGPAGLDIGAETPEGIALSIVAEIRTVLAGREGGFLRNRKGSIYGRDG